VRGEDVRRSRVGRIRSITTQKTVGPDPCLPIFLHPHTTVSTVLQCPVLTLTLTSSFLRLLGSTTTSESGLKYLSHSGPICNSPVLYCTVQQQLFFPTGHGSFAVSSEGDKIRPPHHAVRIRIRIQKWDLPNSQSVVIFARSL
jgi:hypothetical protein